MCPGGTPAAAEQRSAGARGWTGGTRGAEPPDGADRAPARRGEGPNPPGRRQKVNDAVRLAGERVGQSLTQEVIKPNSPVSGGRAGDAGEQEAKGHCADGGLSSEGSA